MSSTCFVAELPTARQLAIAEWLRDAGIGGDDFDRAMNSRLCDLENTVEIGHEDRR